MKKGTIFNFSPRKNGNSYVVSQEIKNRVKNVDLKIISIHDLKIFPCGDCYEYCYSKGECKINDDMNIVYSCIENNDILFFVSPVYFYHLPGYAKIMIDRFQPYWVKKYVLKNFNVKQKIGSIILIGATKGKKLFDGIILTMKYFFDVINCKFDERKNFYFKGVENKNDILYVLTKLPETF